MMLTLVLVIWLAVEGCLIGLDWPAIYFTCPHGGGDIRPVDTSVNERILSMLFINIIQIVDETNTFHSNIEPHNTDGMPN